jgi:hypothetical protein
MSPAEYREWLRQRAVFDDAAFAEYVTDEGRSSRATFARRVGSRMRTTRGSWVLR